MQRTFVYRLYPTVAQAALLGEWLETCRRLWNTLLAERKAAWETEQQSISRFTQEKTLSGRRKESEWLGRVHAHVLQNVCARLDLAFQAFFRRAKAGEDPGYPKFKKFRRYTSLTWKQYGNGCRLDGNALWLSKIGTVKVRFHRPLQGTPKTVTLQRRADGWYVAIACVDVPARPLPPTGQVTGIDVGLEAFATLANGERIANPRLLRKAERRLKMAQRRVSRRKKGSNRRRKAVQLLAKQQQHLANSRRDFHHKTARTLVQQYDHIAVEKLQPANMVQNHHLAKSISDASWGQFLNILAEKSTAGGRVFTEVPAAYTSQACSGCGQIVQKSLSERWHRCACGVSLHRDHNAAINILNRGRRAWTTPSGSLGDG